MVLERVDRITTPLVVGQHYLVWTVTAKWQDRIKPWPVIGGLHDDIEFFDFARKHYHVDSRFLPLKASYRGRTLMHPLHAHKAAEFSNHPAVPLGEPELRRRKCTKADSDIWIPAWGDHRHLNAMHSHYAGQQCARGKAGWICPHKKASLGSVQPVDGVITCPLHLLRIDAASGRVLS